MNKSNSTITVQIIFVSQCTQLQGRFLIFQSMLIFVSVILFVKPVQGLTCIETHFSRLNVSLPKIGRCHSFQSWMVLQSETKETYNVCISNFNISMSTVKNLKY